jgi:predicted RND superfamily exporter protein
MADRIHAEAPEQKKGETALTPVADPRKLIAPALRVILDRHQHNAIRVTATGMPMLDFEIDKVTEREGMRFGLIALTVSVVLMTILFRSFTGVAAPFLVIASTLVILYGIMGWIGFPLTLVSIVVPTLILVISISYSVHVINHLNRAFRHTGSRAEAIRYAFFHSGWPCFVTAATTAVGFASFLLVPIQPVKEMGILCAAGALLTYVLVMVLVPILFSFGRDRDPRAETVTGSRGHMDRWMVRWSDLVTRKPALLGLACLALLAFCIFYTLKIRVESDLLKILGDRVEFVRDSRHIMESMGGLYSYEVAVELPEEGMARDPDVLGGMDALADTIDGWDSTVVTTSLVDIVKDIHMSMNRNRPEFHRIPPSRDLVAQYLLLYEMSGGEELQDWTDYAYRNLRMSVQVRSTSTALEERFREVRELGMDLLPPGTRIRIVGEAPLMVRMVTLLSRGQVRSVLAAFGVITLMMIFLLGSVRVGLLSMIPNTFPILLIGAIMGAAGIQLDMVTVMVMPMIIGIAVDDTVHYIFHFQQEFGRTGRYREANRKTFINVGPAILFTSIILSLGFMTFGLSEMRSMVSMALLASVGILSALAADLLLTPALFVFLRPFGRERDLPEGEAS